MIAFGEFQVFSSDGRGDVGIEKVMKNAVTYHKKKTDNEGISWGGKNGSRLAHAAQVGDRNETNYDKTQKDLVMIDPGPACSLGGGRKGSNACRNRNRDGQDIVD